MWHPDFLAGYESLDLPLDVPPAPGEPDDVEIVATLVRKAPGDTSRTAVLYLHGWNDYFFQTHVADAFTEAGIDFYALDLRRYGRSLRRGQLRTFITDLDEYGTEIGQAADLIGSQHDRLIVSGHSTGGLIAALWAANHQDRVAALILNSPWLDLQGSAMVRALGTRVIDAVGHSRPTSVLKLPPDLGFYPRVLHSSLEGEWDYDMALKTTPSPPVYVGWLRAILIGQKRVAAGLGLTCPVLVMCSTTTDYSRRWHEGLRTADTVLDVDQIVNRATKLGRLVTILRVDQGLHDVMLSSPAVRKLALDDMTAWVDAYVLRARAWSRAAYNVNQGTA